VARKLSDVWRKPVVVENKPGAEQQIGAHMVARSNPDGRTLLVAAPSFTANNKFLNPSLPYNQATDFVAVAQITMAPGILAVPATLPSRNAEELAALIRQYPGKYNYAYGATAGKLYGQMFNDALRIDRVTFVPYRGSAQAVQAIAAGDVHYIWDAYATIRPMVETGKAKIIAVAAESRLKELPDVPTMAEQGHRDLNSGISAWWGLMAPKGTPPDVVKTINQAVNDVMAMQDVQEAVARMGMTPVRRSSEQFDALFKSELKRFEETSQRLAPVSGK
jgi:tripartite-type tricarboxylate transporter receptor subunit TctC